MTLDAYDLPERANEDSYAYVSCSRDVSSGVKGHEDQVGGGPSPNQ